MEIITKFLDAMQILLFAKVALFLALGLVLVFVGIFKKNRWLIGLGILAAFGQFVWPWFSNASYEGQISDRRNFVLAIPKTPIQPNYPRRLIVEGDASNMLPAGWFIYLGYFDEVDQDGVRWVAAPSAKGCRDAALNVRDPNPDKEATDERIRRFNKQKDAKLSPFQQLKACTVRGEAALPGADAIILRIGNNTKLWDRAAARRIGGPAAIQVSVLQGGKETLAHYDEMPALRYQSSTLALLPPGYKYPCNGFDYPQIVANLLDGARQPSLRKQSMERGERLQRSKYDPCIASKAPVPEQDLKE